MLAICLNGNIYVYRKPQLQQVRRAIKGCRNLPCGSRMRASAGLLQPSRCTAALASLILASLLRPPYYTCSPYIPYTFPIFPARTSPQAARRDNISFVAALGLFPTPYWSALLRCLPQSLEACGFLAVCFGPIGVYPLGFRRILPPISHTQRLGFNASRPWLRAPYCVRYLRRSVRRSDCK